VNLSEVSFKILVDGAWINKSRNGNNYHFSSNEMLVIDECADFPDLVGRSASLANIITDSNGNYTVFIPSGNY
jgi:hypothetical protein